jgi:hypothetical protein
MKRMKESYSKILITVLSIVASYYIAVLLHEWGHGTMAWIFGYKETPFDVEYGGWLLQHVDEAVPYEQILAAKKGVAAALIGIAGVTTSCVLFVLSLVALKKIKQNLWLYSFFYWFAIVNMVPIFQYLTVMTFSTKGDVGRFTQGLHISPWWVFIPGTIFVCLALYRIFWFEVPKAYAFIGVKKLGAQRVFLFLSLYIVFLLIYTGRYNPLSDPGMPTSGKIFAVLSFLLVPVLFFICNPSLKWVKDRTKQMARHHYFF